MWLKKISVSRVTPCDCAKGWFGFFPARTEKHTLNEIIWVSQHASRKGCMKIAPCFSAGAAENPQCSQVPAGTNEPSASAGFRLGVFQPSLTGLNRGMVDRPAIQPVNWLAIVTASLTGRAPHVTPMAFGKTEAGFALQTCHAYGVFLYSGAALNKAGTEALRGERDRSTASRKGCMKIAPCFSAGAAETHEAAKSRQGRMNQKWRRECLRTRSVPKA